MAAINPEGGRGAGDGVDFQKGGETDISGGPVKKRGCTDLVCLLAFILHWFGYLAVTFAGVKDGNPTKLYKPRDYRGNYCGVQDQWLDGQDLEKQVKLTFTMNVTHTTDLIAKQLVCSSSAEAALDKVMTQTQMTTYRCACCKSACSSCYGSLAMDDLTTGSSIQSTISGKMGELNGGTSAGDLFSPNGMNGDRFSSMWSQATQFFNKVCMAQCNDPALMNISNSSKGMSGYRNYTYSPTPDTAWKEAWDILATNILVPATIRNTIATSFTFKALPRYTCPYHERYCVPFPGMEFKEMPNNYCTFEAAAAVIASVGKAAADTMDSLGANAAAKQGEKSIGSAMGDAMATLDALVVVSVCSLVIGLIFLVLLRFFVGVVVWCSLFAVVIVFAAAGGFMFIRSGQCKGAGILESGQQAGTAAALTAASAGVNAITGVEAPSEDMTGNGADYRGVQDKTRDGLSCQRWDAKSPHNHSLTGAIANTSNLVENYCRNPSSGKTIWCFTVDPKVRWSVCTPLGIIQPECPEGYMVESETARKVMEVVGCIFWGFGVLWIVLICCLRSRIKLAIAINKCAAMFVYNTPMVLLVPLVQVFIGVTWCCLWAFSASFLLSQVPDTYTTQESFESYAVAYGTDTVPGKCTDKWPVGLVWRDEGDSSSMDDPCSGNMGITAGMTPKCWRCAPPRYIFDVRFACSFFSLLWNNAFLIALGQCIIAGAVCAWFFAPAKEKLKKATLRASIYNCFRFHAGSLAFGAFILAVVQFIKAMAYYLEQQAKAQKNKVMVLLMKVLQCCLWCIEKCVKFLNKNAYIQVAILGKNFCRSAKNAFMLIAKNFARFGVVATLGTIIHFLGFIFIMASTVMLGYFILMGLHPDIYPMVPVTLYIVISYLVAKLYMNVFGLAVDTMLQCFIATEEMGGEAAGDDFVPGPMKAFVAKQEGK